MSRKTKCTDKRTDKDTDRKAEKKADKKTGAGYDYVIAGSGLFAGVFAWHAKKEGKKCLVVEKRDHIGGNLYCEDVEGIPVHRYGAHIFHTSDRKIWDFVNSLAEFNRFTNSPIANYKGELYNLPFNMNTFHALWGVKTPDEAKAIIERQRAAITGQPGNLEEQAISLVGTDVYEKLIKGYTQKQWGRECKDLPAFIIRRLPVRYTYDNNYFNDRYQGIPVGGYNGMMEKLFDGCDIVLGEDFNNNRDKWRKKGKMVLYTGPLDAYFDFCYGPLEYRSLRFESEIMETDNWQGNAVVNYTDAETPWTRIVEHRHFDMGREHGARTVITREYPESAGCGKEPYYPVNDDRNQKLHEAYRKLAMAEKMTIFGGRLAEYRYYDMDKVIASALVLVRAQL